MNKIFNKTKQFVFSQQKSIFSSALILAFMIVIARLFGFLRYRILAGYFTTDTLDIFYASFRIPDLVFEILITGALISSFIPIYIKYKNDKEKLSTNISSIINLVFVVLFIFLIILFVFMNKIMALITPGYDIEKIRLISRYSRYLLIGQLPFLVFGNILTGIGQANKTFFLAALAPVFYNLGIIVATIILAPNLNLLAPVIGVVLGAVLFLLIQFPLLFKFDFKYCFILKKTRGLIEFVKTTIPRILTVLTAQIDATIDLALATLLEPGSYTILYLAQRFQLLPVSVIGIALGQASFPYLSEMYQNNKIDEFKKVVVDSIMNIFFLTIPIMLFFVFARTPLIRLFFGGVKFDWNSTVLTAITLSFFALSLPFHSVYYFLTRCFYAFLDTKTPFILSIISVSLNAILSIVFIVFLKLPVWSLAISFSISMTINVILLFILLFKRIKGLNLKIIFLETSKILFASLISSIFSYYLLKFLDGLVFDTTRTIQVFFLLTTVGIIYLLLYLFIAWLINTKEIYLVSKLIIKAKEYKKKIIELQTVYE